MIWGGIALGLGVHAWGMNQIKDWPAHWSMFPASSVQLSSHLRRSAQEKTEPRHHRCPVAAARIIRLARCDGNLPGLHPAPQILNSYWPGILVILGTYMAFKK